MLVTSYNFETTTRACVSEAQWGQRRVRNSNKVNRFELLCPTEKLFLEIVISVPSWLIPDLAEFSFSFEFPPQTTPKPANT